MSTRQPIDRGRRTFLCSSLLALLAAGAPWAITPSARAQASGGGALEWLSRVSGERGAVVRLGNQYLLAYPEERGVEPLLAAIRTSLTDYLGGPPDVSDQDALRAAVRDLVSEEYRLGELAHVHGWVLSRTEARIYGAAASLFSEP